MVHTLQDYTTKYKMVRVFSNIDDAELAARINPLHAFDRRGNIVLWDDFQGATLNWMVSGTGGARYSEICSDEAFMGDQCVEIGTGAADNNQGGIQRYFQRPPTSKLGAELSFQVRPNLDLYEMHLTFYDGTTAYTSKIRYDSTNEKLEYLNSSNSFTSFATGITTKVSNFCYTTMKLVVDFDNKKYARLLFRHDEYDLSSYSLYENATGDAPSLYFAFMVTTNEAAQHVTWLDKFILTENEP